MLHKKNLFHKAVWLFTLFALCFGIHVSAAGVGTVSQNTNGINTWWIYPLSVRHIGKYNKTYTSYVDKDGYCGVIEYNNRTGKQKKVAIVKEASDDHNAGAVEILPDGRLIYITSGHNCRNYLSVFISSESEQITKWDPPVRLKTPAKCTYAQIIRTEKGYYLFTRLRYKKEQVANGDNKRYTWAVSFSKDGEKWSEFKNIISGGDCQYYIKAMACTDSTDIRIVAYSNPRADESDLRVVYYDPEKQIMTDQAGNKLYKVKKNGWGLYFRKIEIAVGRDENSINRLLDVGYTSRDKTQIVYASAEDRTDSSYRVAEVESGLTTITEITNGGKAFYTISYYFGGMVISEKNPNVLFISRYTGKYWQIEQWERGADAGWKKTKVLKRSKSKVLIRPFLTKYAKNQVSFASGYYNPKGFKDYNTKIVRQIYSVSTAKKQN